MEVTSASAVMIISYHEGRRNENHGVRIMHSLQPLSPVPYTKGCVMENLQFDLKHQVAMNSIFFGTFIPSSQSVINPRGSSPILFHEIRSRLCL
jgi:hypothetical protein